MMKRKGIEYYPKITVSNIENYRKLINKKAGNELIKKIKISPSKQAYFVDITKAPFMNFFKMKLQEEIIETTPDLKGAVSLGYYSGLPKCVDNPYLRVYVFLVAIERHFFLLENKAVDLKKLSDWMYNALSETRSANSLINGIGNGIKKQMILFPPDEIIKSTLNFSLPNACPYISNDSQLKAGFEKWAR